MRHILPIIIILCMAVPVPAGAAMRLVSLKPSITDTLYAIGAGKDIVGVTRYCDIPAGMPKPQVAGDYTQPYFERIIALAPDLVLGSEENSSRRSIDNLRSMGIRVELFPFSTVADTLASIRAIGAAIGMPREGAALEKKTAARFEELKKRWGGSGIKRVIVVWGVRPLIVAGPGTYMDELLSIVGAKNALAGGGVRYPRIGLEELIALDPDAIIDLTAGMESIAGDDGKTRAEADKRPWDGISALRAVREKRIISLNASLFRAGPLLPDGLAKLGALLHESSVTAASR